MTGSTDWFYGGAAYWDQRHGQAPRRDARTLHFQNWLAPFLPIMQEHGTRRLLDLGCGRGFDCLELAQRGLSVTGIDYSRVCIDDARALAVASGLDVAFVQADMAEPLPHPDGSFDAILSNLALHMFPDAIVRRIIAEVRRCLVTGGLFLVSVNSTDDMPHRLQQQPPIRQLADNFYLVEGGQTLHFFSREYCLDVLDGWDILLFETREAHREDGALSKIAWQIAARLPG